MNIVIIGTGNVASVLGRKLIRAGHEIVQIYGRNASAASELAYEWNTESTNYISLITKTANVYLLAVSDSAIGTLAVDLSLPGKIIAHTAAAVPQEVLAGVSENFGVFYPLQSLQKKQSEDPDVVIYTEASNGHTKKILDRLAASISEAPVHTADLDKRAKLHVAAVFANNFTNYLFSLAEEFCKKEGMDFKELLPLIGNTIERMESMPPSQMQTGPAIRKDVETLERHKILLQHYPHHLSVYNFLSNAIMNQ